MVHIPYLDVIMDNRFVVALNDKIQNPESQRRLVLVIVCIALLLDNMLYMVIVPIIPIYLDEMKDSGRTPDDEATDSLVSFVTPPPPMTFTTSESIDGNMTVRSSGGSDGFPLLVKYTGDKTEDSRVGILFASKALVQLMISPISGTIIDRIGYETPMIIGLSIIFLSTTVFAFGRSYAVLFFARSLQGVGSAFADTSGLAMIADRYKEEAARSRAQGIALAFISFGCLFAPPFGGFFYKYAGKAVPFLVLSLIALIDGIMLRFVMKPVRKERAAREEPLKGTPIYKLILDPYIAICAGALVMANVSLAFLEPTIARWMKETMKADELQIGAVWLPAFVPHVFGVYLTVKLARMYPKHQWLVTAVGLVLEGLSCLIIPFCSNYGMVIIPLMIDCFGIALVDTAILPTLAYLVDVRHTSVYGSVYAIADISYSLAYAFGPIVADGIYQSIGFWWLNVGICLSNVIYAPLLLFLRSVYKYKPFDSEDEESDDTGYPEEKPISGGGMHVTNDRAYMMGKIPTANGSAPETNIPGVPYSTEPPRQQQEDGGGGNGGGGGAGGGINKKYIRVGRNYSRESSDDANTDFRTYH